MTMTIDRKELIQLGWIPPPSSQEDVIREVSTLIRAASERTGISGRELIGKGRNRDVAACRVGIWSELREMGYQDVMIAEAFGRCRSCIYCALRKTHGRNEKPG